MFVDSGLPRLFHECYKAGAVKQRLTVKVAGGACVNGDSDNDYFQIGKRNFVVLRQLLWKNGVLIKAHDVGGSCSRTMSLDIANRNLAILVVSTETSNIRIEKFRGQGVGFVHKPFTPEMLRTKILEMTGVSDAEQTGSGSLQGSGPDF
jgi:hypothetical protein